MLLLLIHLKCHAVALHILVFKKKFMGDDDVNCRNSRAIIIKESSCTLPVMQSKYPLFVIVFGAVANDGKLMALTSLNQV